MDDCIRCARPAAAIARRGQSSMPLCAEHTSVLSDSLREQGWSVASCVTTTPVLAPITAPIPAGDSATVQTISMDTPIGVIEEIHDSTGRMHDHGGIAGYRRFTTDRSMVMEYRHYEHGVMADPGAADPAWVIYGVDINGVRFLAHVCRMSRGVLSDTLDDDGNTIFASVTMDARGNATRIESWVNGSFVAVVDPSTLRAR